MQQKQWTQSESCRLFFCSFMTSMLWRLIPIHPCVKLKTTKERILSPSRLVQSIHRSTGEWLEECYSKVSALLKSPLQHRRQNLCPKCSLAKFQANLPKTLPLPHVLLHYLYKLGWKKSHDYLSFFKGLISFLSLMSSPPTSKGACFS